MQTICLTFWESTKLSSKVVVPFIFPLLLLLLLLLSRFSRVRLCATPEMAAHQAPLSLGLVQISPHPCHYLLLPVPFIIAILGEIKWYLIVVLICMSPVVNDSKKAVCSSRYFQILTLTCRLMIHFQLIFLYKIRPKFMLLFLNCK